MLGLAAALAWPKAACKTVWHILPGVLQLLLQEMSNVMLASEASLSQDASQLEVQAKDLRVGLRATLEKFDDVMAGTEIMQSEVTDEVRAQLCTHFHECVHAGVDLSSTSNALPSTMC